MNTLQVVLLARQSRCLKTRMAAERLYATSC